MHPNGTSRSFKRPAFDLGTKLAGNLSMIVRIQQRFGVRLLLVVLVTACFSGLGSLTQATPVTYDTCLQDDSSGYSLQVNTTTGDYKFKKCDTGLTVTGVGTLTVQGSTYSLQDYPSDRRVVANWTAGGAGTASLQLPPGTTIITISDRNTSNNNCGS